MPPATCSRSPPPPRAGEAAIPPMKMYLHQSWTDIILTLHWIPRSKGAMVASWFACFFSAVFVQVSQ